MAYEYLTFGGVLILAALLGTGIGAIHNGSVGNEVEISIVNQEEGKKKRKPFEKRPPRLTQTVDWNQYTTATTISNIPGVDYEQRSFGQVLGGDLIYPHSNEWFKKNEGIFKKKPDSSVKTQELKAIHKELQSIDDSQLTGSKLKPWCEDKYQEEYTNEPHKQLLRDDIWAFCVINIV